MDPLRVALWVVLLGVIRPSSALMEGNLPPEYKLLHDLLDGYNPSVCPKNESSGLLVSVGYVLMSLYHLDEKAQTITVNGWLELAWMDQLLSWDPALYDNVSMVVVPAKNIWIPDVAFQNGVDNLFLNFDNLAVTIYSDGTIMFPPGGPFNLFCSFDLRNFPFDVQICKILLVSWATPESVMKYTNGLFNLSLIVENGEWTILDTNQHYKSYESNGETYSQVVLSMLIKRKPMFQVMNIILPVIMLAFLNLAVFRLPPSSGEKMSLSITVLLAYSVWLLMMSNITPSASDNIPLIGTLITILMGISTVSVFVTVFVVQIHHRDTSQPVPHWLKKLLCRYPRANMVKQISDSDISDDISWKTVSSATDRTAFYILLSVTILLMIIAIGKISSTIASQPSSL